MCMIEEFVQLIPKSLLSKSGKVFYSGRAAFSSSSLIYILGLNPGGSPVKQKSETVELDVLNDLPEEWSAYCDESWLNNPPGTHGLQPRVLHLLKKTKLDPRRIPSSNLIFERSSSSKDLKGRFNQLAEECWPFHQRVIDSLEIRIILCLGINTGNWVARKIGANLEIDHFTEKNKRCWRSTALKNSTGLCVVKLTHPSRANWKALATDPTQLVESVLNKIHSKKPASHC
ncbi:MAG: hypothetical protein GC154_17735 [bacterium]|nr:hypothetical protein [bacterium]